MTASDRQNLVIVRTDVSTFVKGQMVEFNGQQYEVVNVTRHTLTIRHRPWYRLVLTILVIVFLIALVASVFLLARGS